MINGFKRLVFVGIVVCLSQFCFGDEGMWLPQLLKDLNEGDMQKLGCKLSADQIFSVNHSSLKDAIVLFGAGCTGEIVSDEGLLLTNHHCGYQSIQMHSTVENNYLENGFWAKSKADELPTPGLTCTFVVRIEDVTNQVLEGVTATTTELERSKIVDAKIKSIEEKAVKGTWYQAKIKPYFYGNAYYLVVTETFKDVRFVGAPPEAIGKFGGETDNWMWPRHTGDFSVFRIYANEKNEPADYSPSNKPYKPKQFLTISLKGYQKGDFTMTYGFPGRTFEYLTSDGIRLITELTNPTSIALRDKCLSIWMNDMNSNPKIRLQYASKYARISNYYKKYQGEDKGMRVMHTIEMKQALERQFQSWADSTHQVTYMPLLGNFKSTYDSLKPYELESVLLNESCMRIELVAFASKFRKLSKLCASNSTNDSLINLEVTSLKKDAKSFFKDYNASTDEKLMAVLLENYSILSKTNRSQVFDLINSKFKGNFSNYAKYVFSHSALCDESKLLLLLENFNKKKWKHIENDPAFQLMKGTLLHYKATNELVYFRLQDKLDLLYRQWVKGLMEMEKNKKFWPDANSTLRVAYGTVEPYKPFDGALYDFKTTLSGVIEKMDNSNPYFKVPLKLQELYQKKDFGPYAENGDVPVAFIATNHTTGGNSGSPLLDNEGRLLGLNFDTSWEGAMSNYHFTSERVRNISVDIRYVLFIMDKFAGATYLVNEMKIDK